MNNCEIVDNVACGVYFQYCRTHKVEPEDCPGNAKPAGIESPITTVLQTMQEIYGLPITTTAKREFKVGDKVRIVDPGVHTHLLNVITTIEEVDPTSFEGSAPFVCGARSERGYKVCWSQDNLEHV